MARKAHSIKTNLTVMYITVIVVIILCISLMVGIISSNALLDKSINAAQRELALIEEKLDLFITMMETQSLYLIKLQNEERSSDPYDQFLYTSGTLSFFSDMISTHPTIQSIAFYDTYGNVLYSDVESNITVKNENGAAYVAAFRSQTANTQWVDFHFSDPLGTGQPRQWVCSFLRKLYNYKGEPLGILEINIEETAFEQIYEIADGGAYSFYILNSHSEIISAKDKSLIAMPLSQFHGQYPPFSRTGYFPMSSEFLYTFHSYEKMDWVLLSTVPVHTVLQDSYNLVLTICLIGLLTIVLSSFLLNFITRLIVRPLSELTAVVNEISKGNYAIQANMSPKNEIGHLGGQINHMSRNIVQLLDAVQEESALKRQYELSYIQMQMNPHFLYNTLETICGMISVDEKKKAIKTIQNVSSFYRMVLNKGESMISIAQELELTRYYLDILRQRYHEIYTYSFEFEEETLEYQLPKLTLQPFVENAIVHGIVSNKKPGRILIKGYCKGEQLILSISDDGKGIPAEQLQSLRRTLAGVEAASKEEPVGFGIANTYQRLLLFLGPDRVSLSINSTEQEGTSIELLLPRRER